MTALHLLSRLQPKPASLTMPISNSGVFLAFFIVSMVGMSDSASVPISSSPTILPTDDADLVLLASKFLMDHTSSTDSPFISRAALKITGELANNIKKDAMNDEDVRLEKNVVENIDENISSSSGTNSTTALPLQNEKFFENSEQERQEEQLGDSSGGKKNERNSYEMSSPFHVARCRATCLQKFNNGAESKDRTAREASTVVGKTNSSPDEVYLIRTRRIRRASAPSANKEGAWDCLKENSDCLECWKTCELFGSRAGVHLTSLSSSFDEPTVTTQRKSNDATRETANSRKTLAKDENWKGKQSVLDCSLLAQPKQCLAGCQVACSFYEHEHSPLAKDGRKGKDGQTKKGAWRKDPVVTTRHERIVKIVPGKITWPPSSLSSEERDGSPAPLVYMVIQEYPDGKWRQIAQTTETSIDIPKGLTSAMSSKLRSIRVLVVGLEGLQAVYSPRKVGHETIADKRSSSLGKGGRTTSEPSTSTTAQSGNNDGEVIRTTTPPEESNDSSSSVNTNDQLEGDPIPSTITSSSTPDDIQPQLDLAGKSVTDVVLTPSINNDFHVEGPFLFELRVVSLIHQKSLVIAELKWDEIGANPNPSQEYLITWELTEGGLKGHLVTDSTSVTLSLWPDTTYQVQVEEFHQNFDSDGEQPAENSSASLKSLPIIVDTSSASFPSGSAASLSSHTDDSYLHEDPLNEDEDFHSESTGNDWEGDESKPSHESFMSIFPNMSSALNVTIISGMLVVIILTVAALTWIRIRLAYSSSSSSIPSFNVFSGHGGAGHFSNCFTHSEKEPQLLLSQDDLSVDSSSKRKTKFIMKGRYKGHYKLGDQGVESGVEAPVMPVAVISSSSSISSGGPTGPAPFHYYSYKDGLLPSFLASSSRVGAPSVGEGLINASEQGCTSSSFCWLPNSGSGNNTTEA